MEELTITSVTPLEFVSEEKTVLLGDGWFLSAREAQAYKVSCLRMILKLQRAMYQDIEAFIAQFPEEVRIT